MKKFVLLLMISIFIFNLTGCTNKEKNQLEKLGIQNAVDYIEEKYGFTPQVVNAEAQIKDDGPIPSTKEYNGYVTVELKNDNKNFYVNIDGSKESKNGIDNYQQEEILSALLKIINNYTGTHYSYSFTYGSYKNNTYNVEENVIYTDKYYDGSNVKDFLETMTLTMNYIDNSNIGQLDNELVSLFENSTLYLYNFKSENLLNEYQKLTFGYSVPDDRFSNYVNKIIFIKNGNLETYNY